MRLDLLDKAGLKLICLGGGGDAGFVDKFKLFMLLNQHSHCFIFLSLKNVVFDKASSTAFK